MRAIRYRFSLPRYLAVRLLGRRFPALAYGRLSTLSLVQQEAPGLRGPHWAVVRPTYAGICGTDVGTLIGKTSPVLAPFSSFPAVLGHEVVGAVVEAGQAVTRAAAGERVVIDPFISCHMRGLSPCAACARGQAYLCRNAAEGELAPGLLVGFCRDLPGGWSEAMAVHETQLFRVPDALPDEVAVLVEPLSVAIHAILRRPPASGSQVLVLGCGAIGLCIIAAIRLLDVDCHVTGIARYPFQAEAARRLGADAVSLSRPGGERVDTSGGALRAAEEWTGARAYPTPGLPWARRPVLTGGFDTVYECSGTRGALDDGLRAVREGGAVIVIGAVGELGRLDWTLIWARELDVLGSCGYGAESFQGRRLHTFELTLELLARRGPGRLGELITHRFPLAHYQAAIAANLHRARHRAIKTVFAVSPESPEAHASPRAASAGGG